MCMWRPEVRVAWLCVRARAEVFLYCVYFETRSLAKLELAIWLGQWDLLCFHDLASTGVTDHTIMSGFYVGIWGLNTIPMHSRQSPY